MVDTVKDDSKVTVHYTGKLEDGTVFDSSEGKDPLVIEMGQEKVIPGFEEALKGMKVDEKKTITLPPEQAYGSKRDELIQDVPKEAFGELELKEGMQLLMKVPNTEHTLPVTVLKIKDDAVTLDGNPPLAGKTLVFEVEVVKVE